MVIGREYGVARRFESLRVIAAICTLLGWLMFVVGGLLFGAAIYLALTAEQTPVPAAPTGLGPPQAANVRIDAGLGAAISLIWSLGITLGGLQFLAAGALIRLLMQMEENTRATVQLLDRVRMRLEPAGEGQEPTIFVN